MKKLFLSALIVAGATASFAQAQNVAQTIKPTTNVAAPTVRQARTAAAASSANATAGNAGKTQTKAATTPTQKKQK